MTDASGTTPDSEGLRADAGDPNRDRSDLADLPPAQVDDDAVARHLDDDLDGPGDDEAAAR